MITIELIVLKCSWHSLWVGRMKWVIIWKRNPPWYFFWTYRALWTHPLSNLREEKKDATGTLYLSRIYLDEWRRCTEDWLILNYTDIADRRCSVPWNDRRIWSCGRSFSQDRCYLVTRKYPIAKLSWNDFVVLENVHPLHRNAVFKTRIKPAV